MKQFNIKKVDRDLEPEIKGKNRQSHETERLLRTAGGNISTNLLNPADSYTDSEGAS